MSYNLCESNLQSCLTISIDVKINLKKKKKMRPEEKTARDIRNVKPTNCSLLVCYWEVNIVLLMGDWLEKQ